MSGGYRVVHAGHSGVECEAAVGGSGSPSALLLHGYRFRYTTWLESSVTAALEEAGMAWAAPDMPYGLSTSCTRRTRSVDVNVGIAADAASKTGAPVGLVVGASLGGRYAVYLALHLGARALLLSAPALRGDERVWEILRGLGKRGVRVAVLWGTRDRVVSRREAEEAARAAAGELHVIQGAGHVIHRDAPGEFKEILAALAAWARTQGQPPVD